MAPFNIDLLEGVFLILAYTYKDHVRNTELEESAVYEEDPYKQ